VSTPRPVGAVPRDRATLFHLAARDEWDAAVSAHAYAPGAYAVESFIHCSYREQLDGVYQRYYLGRDDLVVLEIDRGALEQIVGAARVIDESSTATGELFPHVYAPLPHAAVRAVRDLDWFRRG
jgi:glutathione S-transferase